MRILVAIASYGTKNDLYLTQLIREYQSMSFTVDIVVFSNIRKEVGHGVQIMVGLPAKNPWSLPFRHKQLFTDRLNDYDVFIYSEDDVLISEKNIRAFLQGSSVLPEDEIAGFFREERESNGKRNYPEVHGHYHWDTRSVKSRSEFTFAHFTNEHSACYILTRHHLKRAVESGGFLVGPHQSKYDLLCTAATDPYTQCGFKKMICISHFQDSMVCHLPNKYFGKLGIEGPEFRRQIDFLLKIGRGEAAPSVLFESETKLMGRVYSKDYYEPVRPEVFSMIPNGVQNVLSIGCGSGELEATLAQKKMRVVVVPLDPVIAGGLEAKGVEIVSGDFETARKKLADFQCDCLLFSNILHLAEKPVDVLVSFGELLRKDATIIAVVPNLSGLPARKGEARRDPRPRSSRSYEDTGVHFTSKKMITNWFKQAGLRIQRTINILPQRTLMPARLTLGLMDTFLASEFIVSATKV
jgi:SAM-dependent methyltransferase